MENEIIVTTQAEWDALPSKFEVFTVIKIKGGTYLSPIVLRGNAGSSRAVLRGNATAHLEGYASTVNLFSFAVAFILHKTAKARSSRLA